VQFYTKALSCPMLASVLFIRKQLPESLNSGVLPKSLNSCVTGDEKCMR